MGHANRRPPPLEPCHRLAHRGKPPPVVARDQVERHLVETTPTPPRIPCRCGRRAPRARLRMPGDSRATSASVSMVALPQASPSITSASAPSATATNLAKRTRSWSRFACRRRSASFSCRASDKSRRPSRMAPTSPNSKPYSRTRENRLQAPEVVGVVELAVVRHAVAGSRRTQQPYLVVVAQRVGGHPREARHLAHGELHGAIRHLGFGCPLIMDGFPLPKPRRFAFAGIQPCRHSLRIRRQCKPCTNRRVNRRGNKKPCPRAAV